MNVQNIPRQLKDVKKIIVPKLDALLFFDYAQIEYRLLAYYCSAACGEQSLAETFARGDDLHSATARAVLGKAPTDPLSDAERQVGKTLNFAVIYGGGTPTIMRQLKCSKAEARRILNTFHEQNPFIGRTTWDSLGPKPPEAWTLNGRIRSVLEERGYITTLWGRHLHPESEHKAINALIQGCAADLLRASLVSVHQTLKANDVESHIVNNVHDEIQIDARMDELDVVVPEVTRCMTDWPILTEVLPILTDVEISTTSWADKEPYGQH